MQQDDIKKDISKNIKDLEKEKDITEDHIKILDSYYKGLKIFIYIFTECINENKTDRLKEFEEFLKINEKMLKLNEVQEKKLKSQLNELEEEFNSMNKEHEKFKDIYTENFGSMQNLLQTLKETKDLAGTSEDIKMETEFNYKIEEIALFNINESIKNLENKNSIFIMEHTKLEKALENLKSQKNAISSQIEISENEDKEFEIQLNKFLKELTKIKNEIFKINSDIISHKQKSVILKFLIILIYCCQLYFLFNNDVISLGAVFWYISSVGVGLRIAVFV